MSTELETIMPHVVQTSVAIAISHTVVVAIRLYELINRRMSEITEDELVENIATFHI